MNPFTETVCCDVCGGEAHATMGDAADRYYGARLRHSDPQVCADNLRCQREADERKKHELENKVEKFPSE